MADNYIAHYTSMDVIFSLFNEHDQNPNKENGIRLYDAAGMNDPNEGGNSKRIIDYLEKKGYINKEYAKNNNYDEKKEKEKHFICSFVSGDKKIGDNLMFWQSYGKDGLGCSIQLDLNLNKKLIINKVFYNFDKLRNKAAEFQNEFESDPKKNNISEENQKKINQLFIKGINKWNFLLKSKKYQHEREVRMVVSEERIEKISYDFKKEGPYLRKYILKEELLTKNILTPESKIIIGPRVKDRKRICDYLEKLAEKKGLYKLNIKPSKVKYQKVW